MRTISKKIYSQQRNFPQQPLFLVTSEIMEKHFKEQCGIDDDKVIRAGYPRCVVNDDIQSYDHDIRKKERVARQYQGGNLLPDLPR